MHGKEFCVQQPGNRRFRIGIGIGDSDLDPDSNIFEIYQFRYDSER